MAEIINSLNLKDSVNRVFKFYPLLFCLIILFDREIINQFFSLSIEVAFFLDFMIIFLLIFYKNLSLKIDRWVVVSVLFLIPPLIVGLIYGWYPADIAADFSRYLAPILGFAAGIFFLSKTKVTDIFAFLYVLGFIHLIRFYFSAWNKLTSVLSGGSIIEYAKNGLEVDTLFFLIFFFSLKYKLFNKTINFLLIGYVIGYLINPIILESKQRFIILILSFFLIFLFHFDIKGKIKIIFVSALLLFTTFYFTNYETIFSRFIKAYSSVIYDDYHTDASTSFRISEMVNVTNTLLEDPIKNLPLGLGLGALYYDNYSPILGGVHKEIYRPNGGVHHIFTVYFAYPLRYGLISSFIFFLWLYKSYKKLSYHKINDQKIYIIISSLKIFIITSLVADALVPVYIYGNMNFGLFLGLGVALAFKSKDYKKRSN